MLHPTLKRLALLLGAIFLVVGAQAQMARTVTLTLNMASVPDTTNADGLIEVRGAVKGVAPITLSDGNVIDWSAESTLEAQHMGGDYWQLQFQIADTTELTFKFFSQQAEDNGVNGWEADPNPVIMPGAADTTLPLHFFEAQSEWHGVSGDRGMYDWRPFASKMDSVAVWYRVAMFGAEADADEYDPGANVPDQQVGVRGARLVNPSDTTVTGPIDWGTSDVILERESTNDSAPGYRIYSGVAYYPAALAGQTQPYKFVLETVSGGTPATAWEEGRLTGNREFTVPATDTTLHWVYYGDSPPNPTLPVQSNIVFGVNLEAFETIRLFDPARQDTLWVFGDFNGWQNCRTESPDDCFMQKVPGGTDFAAAVVIERPPGIELGYKYFLDFNDEAFQTEFNVPPPSGWEEGHLTGINRRFEFAGIPGNQILDLAYFNDVTPQNLMLDGSSTEITFSVNMDSALTNPAQPFNPSAGDTVSVRLGDPIWAHTQGIDGTDHDIPLLDRVVLTDDDADGMYSGTWTVSGPSYNILTFKYMYGQNGTYISESGSDTRAPGRNRTHFIPKNADGTWPTAYTLPAATFKIDPGPLPYETNPYISTGIEQADQIPENIWLGTNYPNPFNPTTSIEYGLDHQAKVRLDVFDMLGRRVATLIDGVQQAATYTVTFDASHLASGVYIYRLQTPMQSITRRMLLVK